jgi:multidrug efflux pump subunit AcrA (membrane-fusion protein)
MNSLSTFLLSLWSRVLIGLGFFRRHLKKTFAIIAIVLVAWISYAVSRPKKIEYVTAVAVKGDLHQLVEAVGTVTSEKALDLQFSGMDVVSQVYVKEGDMVKAGQKLAQLRSGSLSASIASASANVQSAKAALQALEEGSRPEDIAKRIDAVLHAASGSNVDGVIIACTRLRPFQLTELTDGVQYRHLGGFYRLLAQ